MNPLFFQLRTTEPVPAPLAVCEPFVENPATAHDRAYIAAQAASSDTELLAYERAPIAGEWPGTVPPGAVVRVFVINAWSTVRVLQTVQGERLAEPVIDCWRTAPPLAVR